MRDEEIDKILNSASPPPRDPEPEILNRLLGSIRPVRPLPPSWQLAAGSLLVCAAVSWAGAARAGFFGFEKMDWLDAWLIFSLLGILAGGAAIAFVHTMIPGSRRRISLRSLLMADCLALVALFALLFRDYRTDHFFSIGIVCLVTGFIHAIPAALLSWWLLRRGFAVDAVSAGLAAGLLGGLAGVCMLELHCPNFQSAHVLVWHTAVVPLSGAVGASIGWIARSRPV